MGGWHAPGNAGVAFDIWGPATDADNDADPYKYNAFQFARRTRGPESTVVEGEDHEDCRDIEVAQSQLWMALVSFWFGRHAW